MFGSGRGVVGGVGGEWLTGLGLGFTNSEGNGNRAPIAGSPLASSNIINKHTTSA